MAHKQISLSTREKEVLELISRGNTAKEIAKKLFLSPHTVISHKRRILDKLNVNTTAGLIRKAFECHLLSIKN